MNPRPSRLAAAAALLLLAGCAGIPGADVRTYTIADFYKNHEFFGASFSPDGGRLLVSSNLSGIFNAYAIPAGGGEPQPLTRSASDAIFAVAYFPRDERIVYSSDRGGDERSHVYVREVDGSVRDLTPGENLNASFAGWADDERSFFISTNERDARYFDIHEYQVDGYARAPFYINTDGYMPGPISRDKRYIALSKMHSTSDSDVFLHDRQAQTTVLVTAAEGIISNSPEDFTPDGRGLLFTSDRDREFTALYRYDLTSSETRILLAPDWDVVGARYSKSGRHLAVTINQEAAIVSRVYDAATMAERKLPGLPAGMVRGLRFSRDDAFFAFYAADGSTPPELWAGRTGQAPKRLTRSLNPEMRREDLAAPKHVRFKSYDGIDVPGLLYKPHQASRRTKVPALVMVHGGPGGQAMVGYSALTQALVNRGYAVLDINNRGSSGYGKTFYKMDDKKHGEADLGDVVEAKRFLIETGYVDPERVGIIGGSYGGYMTLAALTLRPDVFAAGVDFFGISNWVRTLESTPAWWEAFKKALYDEMGDPATDGERLRRISPLFNAGKIRAPLMVLQGANDPRVLKVESDEIVAAARKNGVPVEYIVFADEGHGFVKKENEIRGHGAVLEFLDLHLKGKRDVP